MAYFPKKRIYPAQQQLRCFILWLSLVSLGDTPLFSQSFTAYAHQYGSVGNLDNRRIFALSADRQGFLWLATSEGLQARVQNLIHFSQQRTKEATLQKDTEEASPQSYEAIFVQSVEQVVKHELGNAEFSVERLAEAVATSPRTLTRKLKAATGLTPLQFINEIRLQTARKMLENQQKATVAEVMYAVGYQSGGHFSKAFQKRFGRTPSSYF